MYEGEGFCARNKEYVSKMEEMCMDKVTVWAYHPTCVGWIARFEPVEKNVHRGGTECAIAADVKGWGVGRSSACK